MRRKEVEAADWLGPASAPPSPAAGTPKGAWPRCPIFAPFSAMRRRLQTKAPPEGTAAILGGERGLPPPPGPSFPPCAARTAALRYPQLRPARASGPRRLLSPLL